MATTPDLLAPLGSHPLGLRPSGRPPAAAATALVALFARCLLLLLAAGAQIGCSLAPREPDPTWSEAEALLPSRRLGLEMAAQAFETEGFQIGTGVDSTALVVASQWRTSLAPFRGKGNRKRAEARLTALEDGRYRLQVRVQQQANMNLSDPLDVGQAEWEWRPEDTVAADILLQKILALLGEPLRQE